nr:MAG TPA: hypothetical protein [Caudoviricetes sp.]
MYTILFILTKVRNETYLSFWKKLSFLLDKL